MNKVIFKMYDPKVYIEDVTPTIQCPCPTCDLVQPLVIGKTDDQGIALNNLSGSGWNIHAYGYDVHGSGSNGLLAPINFCPTCGRILRSFQEIRENRHKS